ncbi:SPOR domain-containing protein [Paenibacillus sediminis]|uniref:Stage II sporulation protein B n=1 Tax=Paenibacillus sediminis TaxID=664909 RepID=A0ABS4H6Z7_9BACL|nr:stage II sporulation protein B [Paenibacillus sediminis]
MNKARMTFRFGNESGPVQAEEMSQEKNQSLSDPSSPALLHSRSIDLYEGWSDPFEQHSEYQYYSEPSSDKDVNHSDEICTETVRSPQQYDWDSESDRPDMVDLTHHADDVSISYRSSRPPSWWKVFGSVIGAIFTGALFGFVVLSLFNGEVQVPAPKPVSSVTPNGESNNSAVTSADKQGSALEASTGVAAKIPVDVQAQSFYMLQYGVFSNEKGVSQAKEDLANEGVAAQNDLNNENRVYAGVAPDREQAKLLSSQLQTQGVSLYVREIQIPEIKEAQFSGEADTFNSFFTESADLVNVLSRTSASLLAENTPKPLASSMMNEIVNKHQKWTETVNLWQQGLSQQQREAGKLMEKAMNSAVTSITEFNKNSSKAHLWEVQNAMMQYILQEKKAFE